MVKNLRALRLQKGVSQQAVADHLGLTQQSVYRYEKDKFEPDIGTLIALADYFGTTVDFLIGRTPPTQGGPQEELAFTKEELSLLRDIRRLTSDERRSIQLVVENYLRARDCEAPRGML